MEQTTNFNNFETGQKLPNASAVLVLGILSILTCCCYGIIGLALGIIALYLAKKDMQLYKANPHAYTNYSNLNTGKILAIIGIVLSAIYIIYLIVIFSTLGMEGLQQMQEEMMRKYGAQ
ncbi:CCC motif membrane protein [Flavobacterium ponti]|uniref:CCC motif membrane protein n=1 Tax=Flavobacterium ponti TaxID=665133 RepID=A0ABV9P6N7_9FLAO